MLITAQFWLVHTLEESPLYRYLGAASAVPAIALNLFGGVFADRLDKRRLIMATQAVLAGLIFLLATLTLLDVVQVWHILAIAFVAGSVNAFNGPAHQALYPHLIDRRAMTSAVALISAIWQGTRIVAPAVAGLIIATAGTATVFYVASAGFLLMATVIWRLKVPPIPRVANASPFRDLLDGLMYIKRNSIFSFLIGMTFFNSFFGMAYVALMPIFA